MYVLLAVAIILRFTLTSDKEFVAARYVYTVDLIMFYLRILQLYYFHKHLGPKVIVIWRMVCVVICVVKSRRLCYFQESRSTCRKFYLLESRSSVKIFYFLESRK